MVPAGCCWKQLLLLFSHSGAERETEVWVKPALASPLLGWGRLIHTITTTVQSTTSENNRQQYFRYFLSSFFWYLYFFSMLDIWLAHDTKLALVAVSGDLVVVVPAAEPQVSSQQVVGVICYCNNTINIHHNNNTSIVFCHIHLNENVSLLYLNFLLKKEL